MNPVWIGLLVGLGFGYAAGFAMALALFGRSRGAQGPDAVRAPGDMDDGHKQFGAGRAVPGMPEALDRGLVSYAQSTGVIGGGELAGASVGAAFLDKDKRIMPTRRAWGELPYEELAPMFLDQFLLRYFAGLMKPVEYLPLGTWNSPWEEFVVQNPWGKEMPLLFEQLTGYKLNDRQLNEAIGEWVSRLEKSQRPATPGQGEIEKGPECWECGRAVALVAGRYFVDHEGKDGRHCFGSGHVPKSPSPATPVQGEIETARN